MFSTESGVRRGSDFYIHTASSLATRLYFYPVCTGCFTYEPGYNLVRSSYDSYLLIFIRKGHAVFEIGGHTYHAHEDQIIFLNCYLPHGYHTDSGYVADWMHFDGPLAANYFETIVGTSSPVIDLRDTYRFEKYLRKIYLIFRDKAPAKEAIFNNWIVNILTELLVTKDSARVDSSSADQVEDIIAYINEHLTEELSLEELASLASLSPFYFTRLFKKETGFTPHEYVIASRINHAKFLLKTTDESIKEICFKTGFSNESSFCTTFKKRVGVTPSVYREALESQ